MPASAARHDWRGRVNADCTFGREIRSWSDEENTADVAKCLTFPENVSIVWREDWDKQRNWEAT